MNAHPADLSEEQLLRLCELRRQRRSGPGGQHRNKVETAVVITHRPSGVRAEATERRSQEENRRIAISRLRRRLAVLVRSERAASSGPSRLWQSRCLGERLRVDPRHEDFPRLLAEALDVLAGCGWEPRPAADRLHVTSSQLIRFLKLEPLAWQTINARRQDMGLHLLH